MTPRKHTYRVALAERCQFCAEQSAYMCGLRYSACVACGQVAVFSDGALGKISVFERGLMVAGVGMQSTVGRELGGMA